MRICTTETLCANWDELVFFGESVSREYWESIGSAVSDCLLGAFVGLKRQWPTIKSFCLDANHSFAMLL
jgi:hypothetical protein